MTRITNHAERTSVASKGQEIVEGLRDLVAALRAGKPLKSQFTIRTCKIRPPRQYAGEQVKRVRELLGLSQSAFAAFIGVDSSTVRSWEQNLRLPSSLACRMLCEIEDDPAHWRRRLATCLVTKDRS